MAFDLLCHHGEDIRSRPLADRLARLELLLRDAPAGVSMVISTGDPDDALAWLPALAETGVEGWVVKDLSAPYTPGSSRSWLKWRPADTSDADLVGVLGPAEKPRALRVRFEDDQEAVTANLGPVQVRQFLQGVREAAGEPVELEVRIEGAGSRHEQVR